MMKLTLTVLTENYLYKEFLEKEDNVELCLKKSEIDFEHNVDIDGILVDGELIPYREIPNIRSLHKDVPIFYKLPKIHQQSIMNNIQLICNGHNIIPIGENLTIQQAIKTVLGHLTGNVDVGSSRVISFFGTNSGAGVSTVALNVARLLGQRAKEKVLVLSLNPWDAADYFEDYKGHFLNDLKVELKANNLTPEKLQKYVYTNKYYSHLAGNRDIKLQRFYQPEEIAHLIDVAKQTYDVVLIDAGTHFDNACYAQAFISSDLRFIVTTQDEKGYRSYFPLIYQQLIEPIHADKSDFLLLVNQFEPNFSLINEKDLQEELEMDLLTHIPSEGPAGKIAIRQRKLLYDIGSDDFKNAIETIVKTIFIKAVLTRDDKDTPSEAQKGGFLSNLFKKKKDEGAATW